MGPDIVQHPLARADGSAVFSDALYAVVAGVNGPVEVSRRDELPEEAAIDVNIRPASGVGGPRERWLESVLHSVLKSIVLVTMHPRTLVQITLQITKQPSMKLKRSSADISIIPTLLNAAFLALVDSGLPLSATLSATLAVTSDKNEVVYGPTGKDIASCESIHAVAYSQRGQSLLVESAGAFDMELWEQVAGGARRVCLASMAPQGEDAAMGDDNGPATPWLRQALHDQAEAANAWRETT